MTVLCVGKNNALQYTATSTLTGGQAFQYGNLVAIARPLGIASGATGTIVTEGLIQIAKTTSSEVIAVGNRVTISLSGQTAAKDANGSHVCVLASGATDANVVIELNAVPGDSSGSVSVAKFATVAEMIADRDLVDGALCTTAGYTTAGDGLGGSYLFHASGSGSVTEDSWNYLFSTGVTGAYFQLLGVQSGLQNRLVYFTNPSTPTWVTESSTFSAWGFSIGDDHGVFNTVQLKIRAWDVTHPISNVRVRVRAGGAFGPVLQEVEQSFVTDGDDVFTATLPGVVDADCELWVEYLCDGRTGYYASSSTSSPIPQKSGLRYETTALTTTANVSRVSTTIRIVWCKILNTSGVGGVTTAAKQSLRKILGPQLPRVIMADTVAATHGKPLQLFRKGFVDAADPYAFDLDVFGNAAGKQYRRFWELTNPATDGTSEITLVLKDNASRPVAARAVRIRKKAAASSPAANKNVLCLGDSLTANGTYVTEFRRLLVGTGGTPAGLGLSNITFVGSQGTAPNVHEGHSGMSLEWFATDPASPLVNSGAIDIANYASGISAATIDVVYILLSWNTFESGNNPTAAGWESKKTHLTSIISGFKAFTASVRIFLIGLECPSEDGLGDDYDDAGVRTLASYNATRRSFHGHNLMLQEVVNSYRTSGEVELPFTADVIYLDLAAQLDTENNMQVSTVAVNARNATTESRQSNGVHPATEGYYQLADVAFNGWNCAGIT